MLLNKLSLSLCLLFCLFCFSSCSHHPVDIEKTWFDFMTAWKGHKMQAYLSQYNEDPIIRYLSDEEGTIWIEIARVNGSEVRINKTPYYSYFLLIFYVDNEDTIKDIEVQRGYGVDPGKLYPLLD